MLGSVFSSKDIIVNEMDQPIPIKLSILGKGDHLSYIRSQIKGGFPYYPHSPGLLPLL